MSMSGKLVALHKPVATIVSRVFLFLYAFISEACLG